MRKSRNSLEFVWEFHDPLKQHWRSNSQILFYQMHAGVLLQTNSLIYVQFSLLSASNRCKWKNRMKWIIVIIVLALLTAPLKLRLCYKHQLLSILFFFFYNIKIHRWKVKGTSFFWTYRNIFLPLNFQHFFSCEVAAKFFFVQNCC